MRAFLAGLLLAAAALAGAGRAEAAEILATGVQSFLEDPSSAKLRAALTDETGGGLLYFQGGDLGTPSAGVLTNATGLPLTTGVTGILAGANGGTGVANSGKTITLGGNLATSGAFATTLTLTGTTNVTLPTTGTLATLAGTETLTNKTLSAATLSGITELPGAAKVDAAGFVYADTIFRAERYLAGTSGPLFVGYHSRGTFGGARVALIDGDSLVTIQAAGDDGTAEVVGVQIGMSVDGAVSTGIIPGKFDVWTRNSAGTIVPRFRIYGSGGVNISTSPSVDPGTQNLYVGGTITSVGDLLLAGAAASLKSIYRGVNDGVLTISGGSAAASGANIELYGGAHASLANTAILDADVIRFRSQAGADRMRMHSSGGLSLGSITDPGTSNLLVAGSSQIGTTTALTLSAGELGLSKITASGTAPGAAGGKLALVCGTNAGTAKLIAYAGTSTTAATILDNIGSGVTGC